MTYVIRQLECEGSCAMKLTRNCMHRKQPTSTVSNKITLTFLLAWLALTNWSIFWKPYKSREQFINSTKTQCHCSQLLLFTDRSGWKKSNSWHAVTWFQDVRIHTHLSYNGADRQGDARPVSAYFMPQTSWVPPSSYSLHFIIKRHKACATVFPTQPTLWTTMLQFSCRNY